VQQPVAFPLNDLAAPVAGNVGHADSQARGLFEPHLANRPSLWSGSAQSSSFANFLHSGTTAAINVDSRKVNSIGCLASLTGDKAEGYAIASTSPATRIEIT
jgi:hypothetical protein